MTLALVRDLMFASKITSAAKSQGISVKLIRDPHLLATESGERLLIDLNQSGAIEAAVEWKSRCNGVVIGFVSHVDAEAIARAQAAGIDQILSRGQFSQQIEMLLRA